MTGNKHYSKRTKSFLDAAYTYDLELQAYYKNDMEPVSKEKILEYYHDFIGKDGVRIYHLGYRGEYAGFLIVSENPSSSRKYLENARGLHIEEAYVLPKYRGKRLMENALIKAISDYKVSNMVEPEVTYFVLKNNIRAIDFWNHQFEKRGYKEDCILGNYNVAEFYLMVAKPSSFKKE